MRLDNFLYAYVYAAIQVYLDRPSLHKSQNAVRKCKHNSQSEASIVATDASDWLSRAELNQSCFEILFPSVMNFKKITHPRATDRLHERGRVLFLVNKKLHRIK